MATSSIDSSWINLINHGPWAVIVFDKKYNALFAIDQAAKSLWRYLFDTDSWIEYTVKSASDHHKFEDWTYNAAAMDYCAHKIFVNHKQGSIATFTFNDKNEATLEIFNGGDLFG